MHPHPRPRPAGLLALAAAVTFAVGAGAAPAAGATRTIPTLPGPLFGIDALNAHDAWAVGVHPAAAGYDEDVGLAMHWDGERWTEFQTPGFGELEAGLVDVSMSRTDDAFAVGSAGQASFRDRQVVVEHWDGTTWSTSPAPDASFNDILAGVSARTPADAWAVGAYSTGGTGRDHPLIEHWNGHAWRIVSVPDVGPASLNAVEAIAANDVWAVGTSGGDTLTMHWDGAAWSRVPSPTVGQATNTLYDVQANGAGDVWAVGVIDAGQPYKGRTLALHWDGSAWAVVATPSPRSGDSVTGVAVDPTGAAWMVGTFWPTAQLYRGLAERLAGGQADLTPLPGRTTLEGVAAPAPDDVWAVGSAIDHWDGVRWTRVVGPS